MEPFFFKGNNTVDGPMSCGLIYIYAGKKVGFYFLNEGLTPSFFLLNNAVNIATDGIKGHLEVEILLLCSQMHKIKVINRFLKVIKRTANFSVIVLLIGVIFESPRENSKIPFPTYLKDVC